MLLYTTGDPRSQIESMRSAPARAFRASAGLLRQSASGAPARRQPGRLLLRSPALLGAVTPEEVDHRTVVLLGPVEDRRMVRAGDDMLLGIRNPFEDRLLAGAVRPLVPRRHHVLVAAEDERRRGDPREPGPKIHVAHGL